MRDVKNFLMDEDGQGMVEYGLIIGLVALLGPKIADMFTNASDQLTTTARP